MLVQMTLLEDMIFGNGESIPGEEDISILRDRDGFPYYKGGTFKGVFREELSNLLKWEGKNDDERTKILARLLGEAGSNVLSEKDQIVFSDFVIADNVKKAILEETSDSKVINDAFSSIRTFTRIDDNGMVKDGSLRNVRCINRGISFYSKVSCSEADEALVKEVFGLVKWLGTHRNRGFGKVIVKAVQG